jgi:ribokinase
MKPEVIVVGSFVQDLTWRCARFPGPGETLVGTFSTGPGGKGSNQAVAAGRAGAHVLFVGAVGNDPFAQAAETFYRDEGLAALFVRKPGHATGTAAILVDDRGQNQIIVALGANARLGARDVPASVFVGAKVVVTQHESDLALVAHVLRAARRAGALAVHNPAPMRSDFDPALLRLVDVLIPNESEFAALVEKAGLKAPAAEAVRELPAPELHALCRKLGPPTVIVTLGDRGVFLSEPAGHRFIPAFRVKAVDTTGAGDAFVGGFAAAIAGGRSVEDAVRFGTATAARSVTRPGTAPSMPRRAEILALLGPEPKASTRRVRQGRRRG